MLQNVRFTPKAEIRWWISEANGAGPHGAVRDATKTPSTDEQREPSRSKARFCHVHSGHDRKRWHLRPLIDYLVD
jgi:hypothetical protein